MNASSTTRVFGFLLILSCAAASQAQTKTPVELKITDSAEAVVAGAHIAVFRISASSEVAKSQTNDKGQSTFLLEEGTYDVVVRSIEFLPFGKRIRVEGKALKVTITLRIDQELCTLHKVCPVH